MNVMASDIESLSALLEARITYPDSKGLIALETYLVGTTSISTEGLIDTLKSRINRVIDKIVVNINRFIGIFTKLTNEEKKTLEDISSGKISSKDTVNIPFTRESLSKLIGFITAIAAWFGAKSLLSYTTRKFKEQNRKERSAAREKEKLEREAERYEALLKKRDHEMYREEAARFKLGVFSKFRDVCVGIKKVLVRVDFDTLEKAAADARSRADNAEGPTMQEHVSRSRWRSGIIVFIIGGWVAISAYIGSRITSFFTKIISAFGVSEAKQNDPKFYDDGF